jgi:hypothetical protein
VAKNTTTTMQANQSTVTDKDLQKQVKAAGDAFGGEKKVKVSIPTALKPLLGPTLPIGVNGVFVVIPTDGEEYEINETHAKHLKAYLKTLQ